MTTQLELTEWKAFEFILEFDFDETVIDLHNCYNCHRIDYEKPSSALIIFFKESEWAKVNAPVKHPFVKLQFLDCVQIENLFGLDENLKQVTMDNFNRGKLEPPYPDNGDVYFLVEFIEGQEIHITCKRAFFVVENWNTTAE